MREREIAARGAPGRALSQTGAYASSAWAPTRPLPGGEGIWLLASQPALTLYRPGNTRLPDDGKPGRRPTPLGPSSTPQSAARQYPQDAGEQTTWSGPPSPGRPDSQTRRAGRGTSPGNDRAWSSRAGRGNPTRPASPGA